MNVSCHALTVQKLGVILREFFLDKLVREIMNMMCVFWTRAHISFKPSHLFQVLSLAGWRYLFSIVRLLYDAVSCISTKQVIGAYGSYVCAGLRA